MLELSMKICTKCKNPKSVDLFAKRSSASDGLASWCKACFAENARIKYSNNKQERDRKVKNRKALLEQNRQNLHDLLQNSCCVDCGLSDWRVLQFDHIDYSLKQFNVSEMLWSYSWKTIQNEINKCEVRCANCHVIRTSHQFGTWRTKQRDIV